MIGYLVIKDKIQTQLMQAMDLFEAGKFIGFVYKMEGIVDETPEQIFNALRVKDHPGNEIVAVIIPEKGAMVAKDHKVYSNGSTWILMDDLVKSYLET